MEDPERLGGPQPREPYSRPPRSPLDPHPSRDHPHRTTVSPPTYKPTSHPHVCVSTRYFPFVPDVYFYSSGLRSRIGGDGNHGHASSYHGSFQFPKRSDSRLSIIETWGKCPRQSIVLSPV